MRWISGCLWLRGFACVIVSHRRKVGDDGAKRSRKTSRRRQSHAPLCGDQKFHKLRFGKLCKKAWAWGRMVGAGRIADKGHRTAYYTYLNLSSQHDVRITRVSQTKNPSKLLHGKVADITNLQLWGLSCDRGLAQLLTTWRLTNAPGYPSLALRLRSCLR